MVEWTTPACETLLFCFLTIYPLCFFSIFSKTTLMSYIVKLLVAINDFRRRCREMKSDVMSTSRLTTLHEKG